MGPPVYLSQRGVLFGTWGLLLLRMRVSCFVRSLPGVGVGV